MNESKRFLKRLGHGIGEFLQRPIAEQRGGKRWALMGTTGLVLIIALAAAVLAIAALGSGVAVTVSSNPKFCESCHEIAPAYEQWHASSHQSVNCLTCHTDAGLPGYVQIITKGFQDLATHASGNTELPAQASISDDNCLRCHTRDKLPETLPQASLRIAHSTHEDVDCTYCHNRLVHSRLLDDQPAFVQTTSSRINAQKDCSVCHPAPNPTYLHGDAQVACSSCHSANIPNHDLAIRRNTALRDTCNDCHTQQRVSAPQSCQTCHTSPHGVDLACAQCHSSQQSWSIRSLDHPVALTKTHGTLQCSQCHATTQSPSAQTISTGNFLCSTCHTPAHPPMDNNCTKCHQPTGWKPLRVKS